MAEGEEEEGEAGAAMGGAAEVADTNAFPSHITYAELAMRDEPNRMCRCINA